MRFWSFVGAKQMNVYMEQVQDGMGNVWTWTALDADSKLIVSCFVGQRGAAWAKSFMEDVASRVASRVQITADRQKAYVEVCPSTGTQMLVRRTLSFPTSPSRSAKELRNGRLRP